jgi:hypothetical protein
MPNPASSTWRASPFFRPLVCLLLIVGVLVALVCLLSRPASLWGAFDARCESVVLPVPVDWTIATPDEFTAFWAEVNIRNIESLTLNEARDARDRLDLTIGQADSARPPSLRLLPGSRRTDLALHTQPGTRLAVTAGSPAARVEWHPEVKGPWSVELSFFDGRFEAYHLGGSPHLSGSIKNQTVPATLSMSSQPVPKADLSAYLVMPAPASLVWTAGARDLPALSQLSASGCVIGAIRFNTAVTVTSSGQKSDLQAEWSSLRTFSLALDAAEGSTSLHVQANGELSSLREAERQLLPSALEQLARGEPAQRGILGVSAALLVFVAGTYLKRALEIMAKLHLPDPK